MQAESTTPIDGERRRLGHWNLKTEGLVAPDERLSWPQTIAVGAQHVVAMFGGTVLAPILMGFDPNVAILFSGVGTLIFFLCVGGRVPSYLGSSFSFIAPVIAATAYAGAGRNPDIGAALGGIIAAGAALALIGLLVARVGHGWIERLMPPVVTGAVVAVIGLNLAPIAAKSAGGGALQVWVVLATAVSVACVAVYAPGTARRLPILIGGLAGYLAYLALANGAGLLPSIDFAPVAAAPWVGVPRFSSPSFSAEAIALILPVAVVLAAENLGHIKAIAGLTNRSMDRELGRALLGDGLATMVSGAGGGTGTTTYAENIGVMAATRILSTAVFLIAAIFAIGLGLSPKFGALILTIPAPVIGGLSIVVFGLITVTAARIWIDNRVDFSSPRNMMIVAIALVVGAGDLSLMVGGFSLGGIGTATCGAILLNQLFGIRYRGR